MWYQSVIRQHVLSRSLPLTTTWWLERTLGSLMTSEQWCLRSSRMMNNGVDACHGFSGRNPFVVVVVGGGGGGGIQRGIQTLGQQQHKQHKQQQHKQQQHRVVETVLLDGKTCGQQWQEELGLQVQKIVSTTGRPPGLGVVLVGDRLDSHVYVMRKREACDSIGIVSKVAYLPGDDVQQHDVRQAVQSMCKDPSIDGVLVQLPLPRHIDEEDVIEHFDPRKDVDGFHPLNVGRTLMRGRTASFVPCTALGCLELLQRSGVDVHHKTVVIVGDSNIVGMPLAMLFRDKGAGSVTIIHRSSFGTMRRGTSNDSNCGKGPVTYRAQETARRSVDDPPHPYKVTYSSTYEIHENPFSPEDVWNIKKITRTADILVIAVGYPELVTDTWIKPGAVVLDVGINSVHSSPMVDGHNESSVQVDGEEPMYEKLLEGVRNDQHLHSIVGDVDAASLMGKAGYLSPVPGGIGPMTVAALVHNTIASASWRLGVPFETS